MSADERPAGVVRDRAMIARTRDARDRVIAKLSDEFAHDGLDVDEFERRVTLAHTASSLPDLETLIADLPPDAAAAAAPSTALARPAGSTATTALAHAPDASQRRTMYAIMSGIDRHGAWTVPSRMKIVAMMGGARLDLREALFPAGPIDLEIVAVMGGVQIIVPPGLAVQMNGTAIMGGFSELNRAPALPDPEAPLLRVHGFAMMGGVDVQMRLPGESERDAHRRARLTLRSDRRAQRALDRADR